MTDCRRVREESQSWPRQHHLHLRTFHHLGILCYGFFEQFRLLAFGRNTEHQLRGRSFLSRRCLEQLNSHSNCFALSSWPPLAFASGPQQLKPFFFLPQLSFSAELAAPAPFSFTPA